jgi:hypothetical protein
MGALRKIGLLFAGLLIILSSYGQHEELGFSIVKMKDGTLFIGKIINETPTNLVMQDNMLGQVLIDTKKAKHIYKEDLEANYLITLVNGNELTGKITGKRQLDFDFLSTYYGKITLQYGMIADISMIAMEVEVSGDYWFPNPNATRYLFAPSAICLKKGEGYYQNAYVLANSANFGVSNSFTIGGGLLLPVAAYVTPKVGFKVTDKFHLGGGVLLGILPESTIAGIAYGLATFGSVEHNATVGLGYGFVDDESTDRPILTINGMTRVGRKFALVTENWIINIEEWDEKTNMDVSKYRPFISYGMRFMWDRFTIDAAFINGYEIYDVFFLGIPYIDFVVKF